MLGFLLLLTSCVSQSFTKTDYAFVRPYGEPVMCAGIERKECGLSLSRCSDGLRYECMINVLIVDIEIIREMQRKSPPEYQ